MSITTLTRRLAILQRAVDRAVTDEVDHALICVEIQMDELHGESVPELDDLRIWFLENFDGDIEPHLAYIQRALNELQPSSEIDGQALSPEAPAECALETSDVGAPIDESRSPYTATNDEHRENVSD